MNIICDKSKLLEGINISLKAIPGKSTMAILECMVIEAKDGIIKLISNDLEIGIETIIEGDIKEPGSVAVNAKVFFEIIRKLPYNEVSISVNENLTMNISCGKAKFNIPVKDTEEFPYLPKIVKDKSVLISQFTLKEVIRQTVFSISDNENTKVMTGELFEIRGSQLKVVSLDGHRISIRKVDLKQNYDDVSVIIPGKTLIEISKILNGGLDDEICMYFTDKHVLFEFDNTIVLSRLIEGEYYKIDKMLSSDYETKITVNKKDLFDSIDRTTLMIRESDDVQLDNIARTVIANNNADCHIALHWDSTSSNKGAFFMSVPSNATYRAMEPVASHWKQHNQLGESLISGLKSAGVKIYSKGSMEMDLTQTSYSTIPSVDIELGDKASDHSGATLETLANGLLAGVNTFFGQ